MAIVDENVFDVKSQDLDSLTEELYTAAVSFGKSFDALNERLTTLTSRGFTGEAADALMQKFNSNVKPKLFEVKKQTDQAAGFLEDKVDAFTKLTNKMEDIARG